MKAIRVLLWSWILSALLAPLPSHAGTVCFEGDRITLKAEGESLQSLLHGFVEQGVSVRIDPTIDPLVRASFDRAEISQAISALIRPYSHLLIWAKREPDAPPSLQEIRIFHSGKPDRALPLPARSLRPSDPDKPDTAAYVPGEILLKPQDSVSPSELESLVASVEGRVIGKIGAVFRIALPEGSDVASAATRLSEHPDVGVEPNWIFRLVSAHPMSTIKAGIAAPFDESPTGDRQTGVAVLDTGFDINFSAPGMTLRYADVLEGSTEPIDPNGHGTQMALIASGHVRPAGAPIDDRKTNPVVSIRSMDAEGISNSFQLMQSVGIALDAGVRVMSLSWGSTERSLFMEDILNHASDSGVVVLGAAGNEPSGEPVYPAAYDSVWGVGALNPDGSLWENSNRGDFVAVYAPGFATLPSGNGVEPSTFAGTSIATAYAAHKISAALSQKPTASKKHLLEMLSHDAKDFVSD